MPMNLLQVQKWLQTLPPGPRTDQLLISYANGANRDQVPPDMALGEMLRRKQMQQKAQEPRETVKDQVERDFVQQQMNTMQAQAAKGAAGQQQMARQAASMPSPVPQGTPQPEDYSGEEMAKGGITRLHSDFNFAPGGIVAFAKGDEVSDPMGTGAPEIANVEQEESGMSALRRAIMRYSNVPEWKIEEMEKQARRESRPAAPAKEEAKEEVKAEEGPALRPALRPIVAEGGGAPRQPSEEDAMAIAMRLLKQSETPTLPKTYEQRLEEERAKPGSPLAKPILAGYEEFLNTLTQSDKERAAAAAEREKRRQQAEFFAALSEGAEASRGQRGIGALLGGVGKKLSGAQLAALDRADKLAEVERDQSMKMAELRAKIEESRRAEARGDVKAKADADMEIARLQREIQANRMTLAGNLAQVQETAKTRAANAAQSQRDSLVNLAAMLRQENPKMGMQESLEAASRIKSGAAYAGVEQRQITAAQKAVEKIEEQYKADPRAFSKDPKKVEALQREKGEKIAAVWSAIGMAAPTGMGGAPRIDTSQVKSVTQVK